MRAVWLLTIAIAGLATPSSVLARVSSQVELDTESLQAIERTGHRATEALERLVELQAAELELRRVEVAVLALQVRAAAIGDIQARIQTLEDRLVETREVAAQMQSEIERIDQVMAASSLPDDELARLESTRSSVERQIDIGRERIWTLEKSILDLENELAAKRRDLSSLEEIVNEGLSRF